MNSIELESNATTTGTKSESVKKKCCGIYGLRNRVNGKWYVGQSRNIEKRLRVYKQTTCEKQPKIYRALKRYGYANFDVVILETCSPEILNQQEIRWIVEKNSVLAGYNCGDGGTGVTMTPRVRKKLSASLKRHFETPTGIKQTVERLNKIKEYNYIKDHPEMWTPEFREKYVAGRLKKLKLV